MSTASLNQKAIIDSYKRERQRLKRTGELGKRYRTGHDRTKEVEELEAMEEELGFIGVDGKVHFPGEEESRIVSEGNFLSDTPDHDLKKEK
jgi:hypothetical protein